MKTQSPPVQLTEGDSPQPVVAENSSTFAPAATTVVRRSSAVASTLDDFRKRLDESAGRSHRPEEMLTTIAELFRQHSAAFVAWYRPAGSRIGEPQQLTGLSAPEDGLDPKLLTRLTECCQTALDTSSQVSLRTDDGLAIHAAPCQSQRGQVLAAVIDRNASADGRFSLMLSLAAARLSEKYLEQQIRSSERGSRHAAALVELMAHMDQCRDVEDGAGRLSRELQRYLQADRVMVGYFDDEAVACTLISDTGQSDIVSNSDDTRMIQAVLEESLGRGSASMWPAEERENRHALQAHAQLAELLQCRAVAACPLKTEQGQTVGAIVVTFGLLSIGNDTASHEAEPADAAASGPDGFAALLARRTQTFLAAASAPVAGTLMLLDRSAPGLFNYIQRACRKALSSPRRRTLGIVTAATIAVLILPLHYRIGCDAELQPVWRRFVAAPFDGTLQECAVRPGDYVERGTLLALMDEREIEWELAGVQADISRASKERNSHLAAHEYGDAAIARHEVERLRHRSDLLTFRSNNLELRSPIDGIVVSGDHRDEEGVPLKTGDTLFEIAPLDLMIVEVAVPEEDIRWVRTGMPVRLQLDALPAELIEARVSRIYPAAELREHNNVFVVEAEISNSDGFLRPGMRGSAKIISDRHTLGWNMFHKPTAWLIGWLGW